MAGRNAAPGSGEHFKPLTQVASMLTSKTRDGAAPLRLRTVTGAAGRYAHVRQAAAVNGFADALRTVNLSSHGRLCREILT